MTTSCGGSIQFNNDKKLAFGAAVEASLDEDWERAVNGAFFYIKGSAPDDEKYDRAMFLLAQALHKLDLTYAASLYYLEIAQSRRRIELLNKTIAGLEQIINSVPHDWETIIKGYLATADITDLSTEQTAFVSYYQGLDSLRQGLDTWAKQQFQSIPKENPYYYRVRFVLAVQMLARGKWKQAKKTLIQLLNQEGVPLEIRNEAELALARLAMEQRQYHEATKYYEKVRRLAPKRPELLLEMAWAHYYLGDSHRALGLLIALDAPIYSGLIAPERYLLEAFCLRRICQFEPARTAAVRLRVRHGDALRDLHAGIRPIKSVPLRASALLRGTVRTEWKFVQQLNRELELIDSYSFSEGVTQQFEKIYQSGIKEAKRRVEREMAHEVQVLTDELVAAEDGVRLILHELSVGLLRGRSRPLGMEEIVDIQQGVSEDDVSYNFIGEFWTDELDDLIVAIPDRCLE